MDSRTDSISHTGSTVHMKKFHVDEDLTIQLNIKGGKGSETDSSNSTRMDKQIQVRHGEHVEIKQHRTRQYEYNKRRDNHKDESKNKRNKSKGGRNQMTGEAKIRKNKNKYRKYTIKEENKYYETSDMQYSGGEEIDYDSRSTHKRSYNKSKLSEGIQASFSSVRPNEEGVQASFSSTKPNEEGVQASFSSVRPNEEGIQANFTESTPPKNQEISSREG